MKRTALILAAILLTLSACKPETASETTSTPEQTTQTDDTTGASPSVHHDPEED